MAINGSEVLVHHLTNNGGDLLLSVKAHETLGLQKNTFLLLQLSAFETLLNNVYEISCPSAEDYANRRDLVRIFNNIATEIYGSNDGCPVVEDFGSFLMDIFSASSDLDLSINFSDKSYEADHMAKIKTLRKFAKKIFALKRKGHVTNVELILSARVPVLKVTDSGSGIECDFSVGNRDGIAKSQIVLMISAIDERFKKLSFMIKAWAKAQGINRSKDGTLNSISLILLAAFHLQTRDIPILPPFSAIFKDGMDPMAVNLIPNFMNYGERNKESLAELFVSLLVKLESVQNLWSRGLCASTYEGSWIYKKWKASGCIRIEDFSDRSQNTARAVRPAQFDVIYSCIRHSLGLIRNFTEGKIDAGKLKNLLFVNNSELPKPISLDLDQKEKSSAKHTKKKKRLAQLGVSQVVSLNPRQKNKKHSAQVGLKGQRPGKQAKHNFNAPTPSTISKVKKKMKSKIGVNIDPQTSDAITFRGVDKPPETLCRNSFPFSNPPIQGLGGITPIGRMNDATSTTQVAQSYSNGPAQRFGESGHQRASDGNLNDVISSFPSRQYSLSKQPAEEYGGYIPQRTHADTLSHGAPNFPAGQPLALPNQRFQSSGGFPLDQSIQHSIHLHMQDYGRLGPERPHVDRLRDAPSNFQAGRLYSLSNASSLQMSDPYTSRPTNGMPPYQPIHPVFHRNPVELNTPSLRLSDPYALASRGSSVMPPYQPNPHAVYHRNPAEFQRPHDPRQPSPFVHSQFAASMHPYQ